MKIVIDIPEQIYLNAKADILCGGDILVKAIKNGIPPVTPQQKTGRWILSGGYWRCSECEEKALLKFDKSKGGCKEYMPIRSDFCPTCGIKMEVGNDT